MSIFAPQAFTKETLSKAFEWLQHQPSSVKQAATNPEMLVSIYTQAQRQGLQKIDADAPVSSRKFIDDLKTLSRDFAQFDDSPAAAAKYNLQQTAQLHQQSHQQQLQPPTTAQAGSTFAPSAVAPPTQQTVMTNGHPVTTSITKSVTQSVTQSVVDPSDSSNKGYFTLDEKSLSHLRYLQERFNLSSPQEALRMAVTVGVERISSWEK